MRWFTRLTWMERLVVGICASFIVMLVTPDLRPYFDHNPDNSLPLESILAQRDRNSIDQGPVCVIVADRTINAQGNADLKCLLINTGTTPIYYAGYSPTFFQRRPIDGELSPFYVKQVQSRNDWKRGIAPRCGTGSIQMRLKPGHAGRFRVTQYSDEPVIRIGVYSAASKPGVESEDGVVWSKPASWGDDI